MTDHDQIRRHDLTPAEVAARAGVSVPTLHFYEREGLIEARRTPGNQRRYHRDVLRRLSALLAPGGVIYAAVPNSRSLHRQAGVLLGCLHFEEDMSELDVHHGHRRVYNPETLRRDVRRAGLRLRHFGGFGIKVLANRQTAGLLSGEQLRAFFQLGERYPDIASDLYIIAERDPGE